MVWMDGEGLIGWMVTEDVFVERSGKVRVHQVSIADGLSDDPADELEVGQVVRVDVAVGVGLEGHAVPGGDEQHVARIEYFPSDLFFRNSQ